jgi:hypothetical protein
MTLNGVSRDVLQCELGLVVVTRQVVRRRDNCFLQRRQMGTWLELGN